VNRTRFPKTEHLPDWARRDNKDTKGDRVEAVLQTANVTHFKRKIQLFGFSAYPEARRPN
jgi:hypothetical protein